MASSGDDYGDHTPTPHILAGLAWLAIGLQVLVAGAPLGMTLWLGLQQGSGTLPDPWPSLLGSVEARQSILNSVLFGATAALCANLLALPLAYLIAVRRGAAGRATLAFAIMIWLLDPGIRVLGWMQGIKILEGAGIFPGFLAAGTMPEFLAVLHGWLPVAALLQAAAFLRTRRLVIDAARECGASAFTLIFRLLLPLNRAMVLFSLAAVFTGSLGSFLEPRLLGRGDFQQVSEWVQRALESETGWPYAAVMLVIILIIGALPVLATSARRGAGT